MWSLSVVLLACSPEPSDQQAPATSDTAAEDGPVWPGAAWQEGAPEDHGYDSALLEEAREYAFKPRHNTQAVAVIKDHEVVWRGHPGRIDDAMIEGWLN